MYSEYEKYLLNIRNSLIQNGIEFPEITKGSMSYYELFKLGIKLSDILLYYRVLAVSGSGDGLENFFLPINTSYVDKIRGICYSEFVSDVLPNYKKLSLGIEPEEETDDVALEDVENTEEVESDFSEDLFNSMFEEDNTEEDVSDDTDDSIENDFDATIKQRLNENTEYVPNGVYLEEESGEETPIKEYSDDVVYTERGTFLDDESDVEESDYDEEYSDEEDYAYDGEEEGNYFDESGDYFEGDGVEESDYSEDDEDYVEESDYSEDEESDSSEDEEYKESDYSEDDEDYSESDYYDEEDDYEESDYSEDEEDYEESDYSEEDGYEESDYSDDESDYLDDDEGYSESDYLDDEDDYSEDTTNSYTDDVKPKKSKDLGDELQDITNTVLTNLKQKAVNFLKKKE